MSVLSQDVYLDSFLAPLAAYLSQSDITDIYVNRPGEIWIERLGGEIERTDLPALTTLVLSQLARQIAAVSAQGISREHPLLAASLPDGSRVQIALPPATRGDIVMAIRKHVSGGMSLEDYAASGALSDTHTSPAEARHFLGEPPQPGGDLKGWLRTAVRERKNILIAGGTSTGKTTFLNALLQEIPRDERLVLIEDTPELQLVHPNAVGLLAARSALGEAAIDAEDLLIASLRLRPDRIILGEMRGKEALTFLRSVNTGHPGSISSIHADSPERAIEQLTLLVLQTGTQMAWGDVTEYVRRSLDVIVQIKRQGGKRTVDRVMVLDRR